jgi:hypothetical protein
LEPAEVATTNDWLLNVQAVKAVDWSNPMAIEDHGAFVQQMFRALLHREAEDWHLIPEASATDSWDGRLSP